MLDVISAIITVILAVSLYLYLNRNSNYWKNEKVAFVAPLPVLGNLGPLVLLKRSPGHFIADLHNAPQAEGQKFIGAYFFNNKPALVVRDAELIKNILVKDFDHFSSRSVECDEHSDPVGANNLFVIRGAKWKYLRSQLSPAFTSAKVRPKYELIKKVASDLVDVIQQQIDRNSSVLLETKSVFTRFTMDVICVSAFGLESNTLRDACSLLKYFGDKIFDMTIKRSIEVRSFFFMPWLTKTFKFIFLQKESTEFFKNVFSGAVKERERTKTYRNDLVDILIKMKEEEDENGEFKDDMLLAQAVFFFTAGFETSSTTISMALYELALQPDIQDKLRQEIVEKFESDKEPLSYEGLFEMEFLDMVVLETLRKYPPMPFLDRLCTVDYRIPGTNVTIEKGTPVFISLYKGIHYDKHQFPEPDEFRPQRFAQENKQRIHPFSFLPFGDGPHMCIGRRFGLMSVKTGLTFILKSFKVEISEKTEIPLKIDTRAFIVTAENGVHLKFVKL